VALNPCAVVAVEVLVEHQVVFPGRVVLQPGPGLPRSRPASRIPVHSRRTSRRTWLVSPTTWRNSHLTTFSTVGYGDVTPVSQGARLVVTARMILDPLVLGLGIRVFVRAVQLGRQQTPPATGPGSPGRQPPQYSDGTS
jgi:Ion channel